MRNFEECAKIYDNRTLSYHSFRIDDIFKRYLTQNFKEIVTKPPNMEDFLQSVKKKTETLVSKRIPEKIVTLNSLLDGPFALKQSSLFPIEYLLPDEEIPCEIESSRVSARICNTNITQWRELAQGVMRDLMVDVEVLATYTDYVWKKTNNDLGTLYDATRKEIKDARDHVKEIFTKIDAHDSKRVHLIGCPKHLHLDRYRRFIDDSEYIVLRDAIVQTRNHYVALHKVIRVNSDKICAPWLETLFGVLILLAIILYFSK